MPFSKQSAMPLVFLILSNIWLLFDESEGERQNVTNWNGIPNQLQQGHNDLKVVALAASCLPVPTVCLRSVANPKSSPR